MWCCLLWGIGSTLLLTAIGCGAGFVFGSIIALVRTAKGIWLLPVKSVFIAYVEFFRRIPFLVILFIVLFAAQAVSPTISLFGIAVDQHLPALDGLSLRDHPRRNRIRAAAADRGRRGDELLARHDHSPGDPAAGLEGDPAAGASFVIMFIKDTALVSQIGVIELMFAGKMLANRASPRSSSIGMILVCYFVMSWPLAVSAAWMETSLPQLEHKRPERRLRGRSGLAGLQPYDREGRGHRLIGPSGSGKSTLLRVLVGLTSRRRGEVPLDGKAID